MGFGGILAALAQGFGNGLVAVSDDQLKQKEEERKYKFYTDQKELERSHDIELTNLKHQQDIELEKIRHRSKLGEVAAQARSNVSSMPHDKDVAYMKDIFDSAGITAKELSQANELLSGTQKGTAEYNALLRKRDVLMRDLKSYATDPRANQILKSGNLGRAIEAQFNSILGEASGRYDEATNSMETPKPTPIVERKAATLIDANDPTAIEQANNNLRAKNFEKLRQEGIAWGKANSNGYYVPRF